MLNLSETTKRVFIYVRVSTQEQAREGYSVNEQIERLTAYCEAHRWIILRVFNDAGYSGGNMNRPALQEMIYQIKKCDLVLVYKLDRLSRSQKDTLSLIEDTFLKNGVDFVSMSENFDTSTPFGKAMIGILAVFAQLEREQIKERTSIGREGRAKQGMFHGGGFIPIGYDYADGKLTINEYEAFQIREMHNLFQSGYNISQIEKYMHEHGYAHRGGEWQHKRIKSTLTNSLYIGKVKFNGQEYDGNHVPIITEETFKRTQEIFATREFSNCKNHGRTTYLGGLLWCKRCGARFTSAVYKDSKVNKTYKYYECHSRRKQMRSMVKDPNCKNKIYPQHELDEMIFNEIRKLRTEPIKQMQEENRIPLLQDELTRINNQRSRFLDLYGVGSFTLEELQEKIKPLDDRKMKLEQEIKKASETSPVTLIQSFEDVLETGDFNSIRLLVNALIKRIEIDGDDIDIYWRF